MNGWRSWRDNPPQIPWAPIELIGVPGLGIFWRPTGIYREEFYSVTGRWE